MSSELSRIQLRLNICEEIITGLFSLGFVTIELKEKLCQLEDCIVQIPETQPELIVQWKRKLVNWWKVFVTAKLHQQGQPQQSKQCHCIQSDQLSSSNLSLDNKPTCEPTRNFPSKSSQTNSCVNNQDLVDVQPSKQSTVLDQMEHAFGQLSPVPECCNVPEYLDRLSQLVSLVAKARALALGAPADAFPLQTSIFTYAFSKLSSKLQQSYRQQNGPRSKSLIGLRKFLTQQISDHIQREDEKRKPANFDDVFCSYCKGFGHLTGNCPQIRALVCFKCFELGHKQRNCTK